MPHDDLFYLLLDWADQHKEIQGELAKFHCAYRVRYINSSGKSNDITFKSSECSNPNLEAY